MNAQTKHGCTIRPIIWQSRACLLIHSQSVYSAQTPWFNQRGIKGSSNHVYPIPSGIFYVITAHICWNVPHYGRFTGLKRGPREEPYSQISGDSSEPSGQSFSPSQRQPLEIQVTWSLQTNCLELHVLGWSSALGTGEGKDSAEISLAGMHFSPKRRDRFYLRLKWESLKDEATFKKVRIPKVKKETALYI